MKLNKETSYLRDIKKLEKKHRKDCLDIIDKIEQMLVLQDTFHELQVSPFYKVYNFEMLSGDRKGQYSCRIKDGLRMILKPVGDIPYEFNIIIELVLEEVSNHYKK